MECERYPESHSRVSLALRLSRNGMASVLQRLVFVEASLHPIDAFMYVFPVAVSKSMAVMARHGVARETECESVRVREIRRSPQHVVYSGSADML